MTIKRMKDFLVVKVSDLSKVFSMDKVRFVLTETGEVDLHNEKGRLGGVFYEVDAIHEFNLSKVGELDKLKDIEFMQADKVEIVNIVKADKNSYSCYVVLKVTNGLYEHKKVFLKHPSILAFTSLNYRSDVLLSLLKENKDIKFHIQLEYTHVRLYISEHEFQITQGYIHDALGYVFIDNDTFLSINEVINNKKELKFLKVEKNKDYPDSNGAESQIIFTIE